MLTVSAKILGIIDEGASNCQQCSKTDRECKRGSSFRFKRVHYVSQRSGRDTRKVLFAYGPKQVWVSTPQIGRYSFVEASKAASNKPNRS